MFSGLIFVMAVLGAELIAATSYCTLPATSLFSTKEKNASPRMTNLEAHPEYDPWTHAPHCLDTTEDDLGRRLEFCLYTRAASGSRREFSIVTTPEVAKTLTLKDSISRQD
jgi:hypothetical protein